MNARVLTRPWSDNSMLTAGSDVRLDEVRKRTERPSADDTASAPGPSGRGRRGPAAAREPAARATCEVARAARLPGRPSGGGAPAAGQPGLELFRAADVLAVDEHLRERRLARHGAQGAVRVGAVQHQFLEVDAGIAQQAAGLRAERAALAREDRHVER